MTPTTPTDKKRDKSRYELEKKANQAIKQSYQALDKINKAYEALTESAEKTYVQKERAFVKEKNMLEEKFIKDKEKFIETHTHDLNERQKALQTLKKSHKEKLEALKLDHKKSAMIIEDEIDALEQEKTLALKEIEKQFASNTTIYEDKLHLYKKNLKKNKKETHDQFEAVLEKLHTLLNHIKNEDYGVYKQFEKDLEALNTALKVAETTDQESRKETERALLQSMNNTRKNLNQLIKTITTQHYTLRDSIESPFSEYQGILTDYDVFVSAQTKTLIENIKQDYDFETARINNLLKPTQSEPLDAKAIKDLKARIKLAKSRRDILIEQANGIQKITKTNSETIKNTLEASKKDVLDAFEKQEVVLKNNHNQLKELFSLIEKNTQALFDQGQTLANHTHPRQRLERFKDFVKIMFDAFLSFEEHRLTEHIKSIKKIEPIIMEIDEISMYLDTVEPLKEIEINKQKRLMEQEDSTLRFDMRGAKLQHNLNVLAIKHDTHIKEQNAINGIKEAKETHQFDTLRAQQKHDIVRLEVEEKDALSASVFALRRNHVERELDILEKRLELDIHKLKCQTDLSKRQLEKETLLQRFELEYEYEEKTLQYTKEIEHYKQSLEITLDKQNTLTEKYRIMIEDKKKSINDAYEKETASLTFQVKQSEDKHHEKIAFIDRALEKETAIPAQHIREIKSLMNHRMTLLQDHTQHVLKPVKEAAHNLKQPDAPLKSLLTLIAKPYINGLSQFCEDIYNVYEDALNFIHSIILKHIENDDSLSPRKIANLCQKARNDHEKIIHKLHKQSATLTQLIVSRTEEARALIKADKSPTLLSIRQIMAPLIELLLEKIPNEVKTISQSIKTQFKALYQNDQELIDRAKANHTKAVEQANARFADEIRPLKATLDSLDAKREKAIEKAQVSSENELNKKLEPLNKDIETIRAALLEHASKKQIYTDQLNREIETLEDTLQQEIAHFDDLLERNINNHKTNAENKRHKLNARLEDAENILAYEKRIHQNELEHQENILQDILNQAENLTAAKTADLQKTLDSLKDEENAAIEKEKLTLQQANERFQQKMLTSIPRLEALAEEASRKIDQEAELKKQQRDRLSQQLKDIENAFRSNLSDILQSYSETINTHMVEYQQDDDETPVSTEHNHLEPLIDTTDTLLDHLIKQTLKDITERD